jgi:hypothetical protein
VASAARRLGDEIAAGTYGRAHKNAVVLPRLRALFERVDRLAARRRLRRRAA